MSVIKPVIKAFWAIYISIALSYLGVGLVAPLIAIVLAERGADSFIVGLVGTTMFAAFTAASFPIGRMTDRIGPKPVLIGGLAVYGISILLFALITQTWLFFAARAVEGVGAAAISVATETMISQLSRPDERAQRMSYYALSVGAGWAAGPLAGTLLFNLQQQLPFIACCALSLAAAMLVYRLVPKTGPDSHHLQARPAVFSSRLIVPVSAGALHGYLMSSLVTLIALYFTAINVSQSQIGIIITAVIMGTLVAQVPIGKAADRFGKRPLLLICAALLALVFAVMPIYTDWKQFLVSGALCGALAGTLYPIGLAMIGEMVSRERLGAANSLFSLAFGIGSLTGPAFSGFAMKHFGYQMLFYLPAGLVALFVLEMIFLKGEGAASESGGDP